MRGIFLRLLKTSGGFSYYKKFNVLLLRSQIFPKTLTFRDVYFNRTLATSCDRPIDPDQNGSGASTHYEHEKLKARFRERIADVKDNVLTVPNALCIGRICITPIIGYLVVVESFFPACLLFGAAGFTDMLDGYIARRYPSQKSMLGSILDPVADKLLISTLFVTLAYSHLVPVILTSIVILRDSLLIIGGFVRRYQLLEPPVTLRRYFDTSVSSLRVEPTLASKISTVLQLSLVTLSLASPVFGFENHPFLSVLCVCTGATTIYSGFQYVTGKAMMPVKKLVEKE